MNTFARALVTAGATALLCMTPPLHARAATGTFTYYIGDGRERVLQNPQDNECYSVLDAGGLVENGTDATVVFFAHAGCTDEGIATLAPGGWRAVRNFGSFVFVRPNG
ncbi:hypothetical protein AB0I39_32130 [Kitasatospora purpeofusca]|uniref:hypothetical protein n=1 Tax=Kitasatospora purpeofusca TaxID=67352 RepID=UPI0033DB1E83